MEGAIEVVATVQGIGKVGCGYPEVGKNLWGGGPGSSAVWIVDVVDETAHWGGGGGGFHNRVACRLMGRKPRRGRYSRWLYPPLVEAMEEVLLQEVAWGTRGVHPHRHPPLPGRPKITVSLY